MSNVNTVLGHKENVDSIYLYYLVNFAIFSMLLCFLFYLYHHSTDKLHPQWCEKGNEWLFTEMCSNSGAGLIGIKKNIKLCILRGRLTKPTWMSVFALLQKFSVSPSVLQCRQHYLWLETVIPKTGFEFSSWNLVLFIISKSSFL